MTAEEEQVITGKGFGNLSFASVAFKVVSFAVSPP